jgi:predicted ATPase
MELLLRRWRRVRKGEGQVVFLFGEAGIGKSRLSRALEEWLAGETHAGLRYFCSPHHQGSALHPFTAQLERAAGFTCADAPRDRFAKLEGLLARSTAEAEEIGLITELLSLPSNGRYCLPEMSPQRRKEKTLDALLAQLAGLAAQQPVLMLFEDAHWIDPTSLELLGLMVERVARLSVLLLVTARPEFAPPWPCYAHVTSPTLTRLSRHEGTALVGSVTGGKALPSEVMEQILDRTDGVPLFVEELTKTVLESGLLRETDGGYVLTGSFQPLTIPTTLHASLLARLGRLAPAREVAQIGAVIGREFSHGLLTAVAPMSANLLRDALEQLVNSELILRRGVPPDAVYTFKHALVQDAAYQSLLKSKRQQLHARIAEVLEERPVDVGETEPELLAQHLTDADLAERAIPYWCRAGELAAGRSANLEAITHLNKGLELVGILPSASEHLDEELALRLAIGGQLLATKGYAAPEVERNYSRARVLCEQLSRSAELFAVLRGLWNCYLVRGEFQRAYDLAERLVALAEDQGVPLRRALAKRAQGTTLFFFGRFANAAAALNEGIVIDDAIGAWEERRADLLLHTERAAVACRLYSAEALWFLGFPDSAQERIESSLAIAQRLEHVNSLAFALTWAAILHNLRREFAEAQGRAEAAIEIASRHSMSAWFGHANVCRGFALAGLGHQAAGIAQLRTGLAAWNATGGHLLDTQWLGFLADAHLQAGQFDDALSALDQATDTVTATGECHYQAELYRLRGTVYAEIGENAEAASWLRRAVDTARTQQARSLELRAATSLAGLWANQGRRVEAYELLAPVYGWFTEGFDTPDLKDARMLLNGLA